MSNKKSRTSKKKNLPATKSFNDLAGYKNIINNIIIVSHIKEVALIILLALAGFFFISLVSYHPLDAGWSRTSQHLKNMNIAGNLGAWWADLFLYFFGITAYLFPIILISYIVLKFFNKEFNNDLILWVIRVVGFILTLLSNSAILSLLEQQQIILFNIELPVSIGGVLGDIISNYFFEHANFWGAMLILISCLLAGITAMTGISWISITKLLFWIIKKIILLLFKYIFLVLLLLKTFNNNLLITIKSFYKKQGAIIDKRKINLNNCINAQNNMNSTLVTSNIFAKLKNKIKGFIDNLLLKLKFLNNQKNINDLRDNVENNKELINNNALNNAMINSNLAKHNCTNKYVGNDNFNKNCIVNNVVNRSLTNNNNDKNKNLLNINADQQQAAKNFIKQIKKNKNHINIKIPSNHQKTGLLTNGLPNIDLLEPSSSEDLKYYTDHLPDPAHIQAKLADFGVLVKIVDIFPGPVVTRVEMELAPGTKANKVTTLSKDLARSLSVPSVRVVEVIPGKTVIGLEIPNKKRILVRLRDILSSEQYVLSTTCLPLALGKDIAGIAIVTDLARMPHLLIAGTTGSGKSVGVNVMLLSILFKATPEDVRLILIDPKMLELSIYEGIPHQLSALAASFISVTTGVNKCKI